MAEPDVLITLKRDEYAELVGTALALRGLAEELADTFRGSAGRKHEATRGAEQMLAAAQRLLEILRYPE